MSAVAMSTLDVSLLDHFRTAMARAKVVFQARPAGDISELAKGVQQLAANLAEATEHANTFAGSLVISDQEREFLDKVFLDEKAIEVIRQNVASIREMDLQELPEESGPLDQLISPWIRPYNDAIRNARRVLNDYADFYERRLAEESAEDAEADAWNRDVKDVDTAAAVPFDDAFARLRRS